MDRTPITAITIDGRATPPKVMTTSISTARRQCLQLAPIINVAADIPKGQVHLQNVPKTNQANYNVAPPENAIQGALTLATPTNKASQHTSRHMGCNIIIFRRSNKAFMSSHCFDVNTTVRKTINKAITKVQPCPHIQWPRHQQYHLL